MPTYQYQCHQCKTKFELKQSFRDKSTSICPVCSGNASRLFSAVPIIFKGPGFYVTDSRTGEEINNPDKTAGDDGSNQGDKA